MRTWNVDCRKERNKQSIQSYSWVFTLNFAKTLFCLKTFSIFVIGNKVNVKVQT